MERDAANGKYVRLHEARQWHNGDGTSWAEKPSDEHPFHRDSGVTIGVAESDVRAWDMFTTVETAPFQSPTPDGSDEQHDPSDHGDPDH